MTEQAEPTPEQVDKVDQVDQQEQAALEPEPDARELMVMGLGGAKFVVEFYSKRRAADAVYALAGDGHGHHFAVVSEGHHVVLSHMAVDCLRRAGMLPVAESFVYENVRE